MTESMRNYYAGRERAERRAARSASCAKIRGVHLALAKRYARLAKPQRKHIVRHSTA